MINLPVNNPIDKFPAKKKSTWLHFFNITVGEYGLPRRGRGGCNATARVACERVASGERLVPLCDKDEAKKRAYVRTLLDYELASDHDTWLRQVCALIHSGCFTTEELIAMSPDVKSARSQILRAERKYFDKKRAARCGFNVVLAITEKTFAQWLVGRSPNTA